HSTKMADHAERASLRCIRALAKAEETRALARSKYGTRALARLSEMTGNQFRLLDGGEITKQTIYTFEEEDLCVNRNLKQVRADLATFEAAVMKVIDARLQACNPKGGGAPSLVFSSGKESDATP